MTRNAGFQSLCFLAGVTMPLPPEQRAVGTVCYYCSFVFLEAVVWLDSPAIQICQESLSCHQNL